MITLRRAKEREHHRRRKYEVWRTFPVQDRGGLLDSGFGDLGGLNESRVEPGGRVPNRCRQAVESITYVREGAVACEDSAGGSCLIQAGEFQQRSAARGVQSAGMNAASADGARVFQIWLHSSEPHTEQPSQQPKRFSAAQRRGHLCVIASPDGRKGSLRVHQDILIHSALLDPGRHVVHELSQGRSAWLHLVEGEAVLGDIILGTGDGAGVTTDRAVSITAREPTEILLLDLRGPIGDGTR